MPIVSVIVPVHNTAKYLEKCVDSITDQTLKDIEIILVENASTDNSLEVCNALAEKDTRIKVLRADIGDPSLARNIGIDASEGKYLGFIDSDDTIAPEMYSELLSVLESESLDIVFCDFMKKYDYRSDRYVFEDSGKITLAAPNELLKLNFKDKIPQSICTLLCKRQLFDNIRFPVGRYYEDTATTWKLILEAQKTGHIARPYYHYYRHSGSIVHTASFKIHYGHVMADMERLDYINGSREYSEIEKLELGVKPMSLFYKHFNRMVALAETEEERTCCLECRKWVLAISRNHDIKLKYAIARFMVRRFWGVFCFLKSGRVF